MEGNKSVTRCGFVALIGAPNVGKSTLTNLLVGSKVSIVTPKVQTTRNRVIGIAIDGQTQAVYVDTPGVFKPKKRFDRAMVDAAWSGARDADLVAVMIDAGRRSTDHERQVLKGLSAISATKVAIINKIDVIERPKLLTIASALDQTGLFEEIFMISALKAEGIDEFRRAVDSRLPFGPWLYPEDQVADMPLRLYAAEITREQIFLQLQQELPYATAVETESWTENKDGSVRIDQIIYVQRDGQRKILLGKSGNRIKEIGSRAREVLQSEMERRVHLFLRVKVSEKWAETRAHYATIGLNFES